MTRRSPRRRRVRAALLVGGALLAAAPAADAAPTWRSFAPLFTSPAPASTLDADLDAGGRGAVLFTTPSGTSVAETPTAETTPVAQDLTTRPATQGRVAVAPGGAMTVAVWTDATGLHVRTRTADTFEPPQDLAGTPSQDIDATALADGSVVVVRAVPSGNAKVWRRSPGMAAFAALPDVVAPEGQTVDSVLLRAVPGGGAVLAMRTTKVTTAGTPPFDATTVTHRASVARLPAGGAAFGAVEATGIQFAYSSGAFVFDSGSLAVDDVLARADGVVEVAASTSSLQSFAIATNTIRVARRTPAGTWGAPATVAAATGSLAGADVFGPLRLVRTGAETLAVWTRQPTSTEPGSPPPTELHRARGAADFADGVAIDTAAVDVPLAVLDVAARDADRGLALVREGDVVRAVTFSADGAIAGDDVVPAAPGAPQSAALDTDGRGEALAAITTAAAPAGPVTGTTVRLTEPPAAAPPVPGGDGAGGSTPTPSAAPPARDVAAPVLSGLRLSRTTLARRGSRATTTLTWRSSEAARIAVAIQRVRAGWATGSRCQAKRPRRAKRGAKRCDLVVGRLAADAKPGAGSLRFTGKVAGKALARGSYRFSLVATDAAGNRGAARTIGFTVTR